MKQKGFSLIEIMVAVVILGILATLIVPQLLSRPEQAREVKARQDVLTIANALELYKLDNGVYPTTDQGLAALVNKPDSDPMPSDWQGYLKTMPEDPWGHAYQYITPGEHGDFDVYTVHQNKTFGNWNAKV